MSSEISIPINKSRLLRIALGGLVLLLICLYFSFNNETLVTLSHYRKFTLWLGVPLFSLGIISILARLMSSKPGLLIDQYGILDQSSWFSLGTIPWKEIHTFEISEIRKIPYLIVILNDPSNFLRNHHLCKRLLGKMNHSMSGSPVSIAVISLEMMPNDLKNILERAQKQFKVS